MENLDLDKEKVHKRTATIGSIILILLALWVVNYFKQKTQVTVYCHNVGTPVQTHFMINWYPDLKVGAKIHNPKEPTGDLYTVDKIVP